MSVRNHRAFIYRAERFLGYELRTLLIGSRGIELFAFEPETDIKIPSAPGVTLNVSLEIPNVSLLRVPENMSETLKVSISLSRKGNDIYCQALAYGREVLSGGIWGGYDLRRMYSARRAFFVVRDHISDGTPTQLVRNLGSSFGSMDILQSNKLEVYGISSNIKAGSYLVVEKKEGELHYVSHS